MVLWNGIACPWILVHTGFHAVLWITSAWAWFGMRQRKPLRGSSPFLVVRPLGFHTSNTWSLNEYSKLASPLSWISGRLTGWPLIARHFMIFWFACYIILGISNFASIFAQTCPPFLALRQLWRAPRSTRNTCKQTSHDMLSLSVNTMDEVYTWE